MDRLQAMRAFEQVATQNGFSAAARRLDVSPAVVTHHVQALEDHLGVRLLQRTTRRLALTQAGEAYLDRVKGILADIDEADEIVRSQAHEMCGNIRVGALPGLSTHLVAPAVASFRARHPKVTIDLRADALAARSIAQNDLTLLADQTPVPADAVVRRVSDSSSILCASPAYLQRRGEPRLPQELRAHDIVRLSVSGGCGTLRLFDETDEARAETIVVEPALLCNDHEAALRSTLDGAGISSQSRPVAAPLLRAGRLRRVLTPWIPERFALLAVFASRRHLPARTRAFLEHLIAFAERSQSEAL